MRVALILVLLPMVALADRMPSDLPEYGVRMQGSIRVMVFGIAVGQPGWYLLPRDAAVQDAAVAAKAINARGLPKWDPAYSSIKRQKPDGFIEKIRLRVTPAADKVQLRDGDIICLSHESY